MLILDNSPLPCLPLSATKGADKGISRKGGQCEECKVTVPRGLERHEKLSLCPMCHLTQHLAEAARLEAGKVIWLPQISQTDLNRFMTTFFMLLTAPPTHEKAVAPMRARMKAIYQDAFETRAARDYEEFLNPDLALASTRKPSEPQKPLEPLPVELTSPILLAHAIEDARAKSGFDRAKLDGLRLLFFPAPFRALIRAWRDDFYRSRLPSRWTGDTEAESANG